MELLLDVKNLIIESELVLLSIERTLFTEEYGLSKSDKEALSIHTVSIIYGILAFSLTDI